MEQAIADIRARCHYTEDEPVGIVKCFGITESIEKASDTSRMVTTIFTTDDVDLSGDVILPEGADFDFHFNKNGKRVFVDHHYDLDGHVGVARRVDPYEVGGVQRGWKASVHILPGQRGDEILEIAKIAGIGASIGIRPFEMGPPTEDERTRFPGAVNIIRRYGVLEFSITAMPQNSACQGGMMTRSTIGDLVLSKAVSPETAAMFGVEVAPPRKTVILW